MYLHSNANQFMCWPSHFHQAYLILKMLSEVLLCAASNGPANYQFNYSVSPFTFAVARANSNGEALFNTVGTRLVFKVRPWPCRSGCTVQACFPEPKLSPEISSAVPVFVLRKG